MLKTPWNNKRIALITMQRDRLYRIALSWCGDRMLADDLTHEAISKGVTNQHQLADPDKLSAWIFRILHNCWMEYLRKYRPTLDLDHDAYVSEEVPEINLSQTQTIHSVRQAIGKLPMGQRQVITLVDLEERSYAEVTEILDIPMGTVMSRLNRARTALKNLLSHLDDSSATGRPLLRRIK
jgi:RNA polymerase sigma-70 factor (ECF subfamily)